MSADEKKEPPPYIIPVESQGDGVRVYHPHTPFTPPSTQTQQSVTPGQGLDSGEGKKKFVSYDMGLGTESGMTTCASCQQQVMTNVTYKAGTYAWLMCLLFICFLCCCLIPFFMKRFKDAYHTCPRCNRVLHVEKRKCCK
uniref:Lipopolysaccharide-induced tumor necrosis factor-alpha factor homolog n=1 Tax=Pundamilia nyererei TaxID=303518 RepID=A0A3B4HDA6_9CICH